MKFEKDPHNIALKQEEATILKEYNIAVKDEEKLLFQKAKIEWLCDGDRNTKFFSCHFEKQRAHKSRIESVNNENGERFEGDHVSNQFIKHFQNFQCNIVTWKDSILEWCQVLMLRSWLEK